MAQKVSIILVDDIDGGEADETVAFALDGSGYEIDLSSATAAKLREALAPYIGRTRPHRRPLFAPTRGCARPRVRRPGVARGPEYADPGLRAARTG